MPKIIDIIKQVEIKEVCVSNQYKIEDIELLNNSTNSKISISINYENFDYNFFEQIKNNVSSFYYDLNIYRKDVIEKKSLMECESQINQVRHFL